jgi:hypothetical protein
MLKNFRFGKHCSCHLQGEDFWKPCIGQTVGGELDLMVLGGGAKSASKNAQPLHIHPEDGNRSFCRNVR